MYLYEVLCTHCQAAGLDVETESEAVCRFCGTVNPIEGVICAQCEFVNVAGAEACADCHQALFRKCPNCGTLNWAGAEQCIRCQNKLDVVAQLGARYRTDTAGRLRGQQHEARSIKAKEAADAERRTAELNAIEQRRQQFLGNAIRTRDSQQRFWIAALIVLSFIVVAGALLALVLLYHR